MNLNLWARKCLSLLFFPPFLKLIFITVKWVFGLCVCMSTSCLPSVHRDQNRMLDPWKLELHIGPGNWSSAGALKHWTISPVPSPYGSEQDYSVSELCSKLFSRMQTSSPAWPRTSLGTTLSFIFPDLTVLCSLLQITPLDLCGSNFIDGSVQSPPLRDPFSSFSQHLLKMISRGWCGQCMPLIRGLGRQVDLCEFKTIEAYKGSLKPAMAT